MSIPTRFMHNPAQLAGWLEDVLPAAAIGAEMRSGGDPSLLYPEEAACLGRSVPKRVAEFAAGRLCARRALAALGVTHFPVRAASDRQPIWPDGIVGSITHTKGFCLAAVASKERLSAIGLDTEVASHVTPDLWETICGPAECTWLDSLADSEKGAAAVLLFSAKEAFYKCQYPLTREWLDFKDLQVHPAQWNGAASGSFTVHPTRRLQLRDHSGLPFRGRYIFHDGFMTAGIAIPATGAQ